jgi:hypothetical protein
VHADHYVAFLEEAYARFMELPNHGPEVLPNVAGRGQPRVSGIVGRAGWYMGDLSCATMEGTFRAAYASAQTAIAGAQEIFFTVLQPDMIVTAHDGRGEAELIVEPSMLGEELEAIQVDGTRLSLFDLAEDSRAPDAAIAKWIRAAKRYEHAKAGAGAQE